ncbi:hypothetical protein BG841_00390 [Marinobacter sp. X15-166B]|nr:hypothetical protein BG841_00390 [Marinobacter sp. X15-166B]
MDPYALGSYVIRYGRDSNDLDQQIVLPNDNPNVQMSYRVANLAKGEWFFTVQAVDADGLMSAPSAVVSKRI